MFKKILVPVDGSEISTLALRAAIQLAKEQNAKIEFLHVVDEQTIAFGEIFTTYPSLRESLKKSGEEVLAKMSDIARETPIDFESKLIELRVLEGKIAEKILEEANDWSADLIVIGSHGKRGMNRMLLGSVAENVMRLSSLPVLLIKKEK